MSSKGKTGFRIDKIELCFWKSMLFDMELKVEHETWVFVCVLIKSKCCFVCVENIVVRSAENCFNSNIIPVRNGRYTLHSCIDLFPIVNFWTSETLNLVKRALCKKGTNKNIFHFIGHALCIHIGLSHTHIRLYILVLLCLLFIQKQGTNYSVLSTKARKLNPNR